MTVVALVAANVIAAFFYERVQRRWQREEFARLVRRVDALLDGFTIVGVDFKARWRGGHGTARWIAPDGLVAKWDVDIDPPGLRQLVGT